jgi:aminomethyltransferase
MKKTALNQAHRDAGAKMVDFGGWEMPINYGSQIEEHLAVRRDAGVFDVSHMTVVDVEGPDSDAFLLKLLANDVRKLANGQALYSTMLNENGGVVDDLIVYRVGPDQFRIVVNAATRAKDLAWMQDQSMGFDVELMERPQLAMLAVQGPQAIDKVKKALPATLAAQLDDTRPFHAVWDGEWFVGRTGYTGEDGVEVMLPEDQAETFWKAVLAAGVRPCGLGARDTLRLEAGMHLYGQDMDETVTPLECGLGWTVRKTDNDFTGAEALQAQRETGIPHKLVGLVLEGKGVLRHGQELIDAEGRTGLITSGTYSPTTGKAIAMARVPSAFTAPIHVKIRNRELPVKVVKLPFVRHGKIVTEL